MDKKPNIVILGGGFGGIRCALDLVKKSSGHFRITLIDKNGYHFFPPSLYEIASAYEKGDDPYRMSLRKAIAIPYSEIFDGKDIEVIQAEISGVDLASKRVNIGSGGHVDFDYLVFALGSQASDFGIPGVNEYVYQFKTPDDAVALNKKIGELFADAAAGQIALPMKLMIIGAGFTGIELAAELVMYARKVSKLMRLNRRSFSVALFEAAPHILPMISDKERKIIMERLTSLGVAVMAGSVIESVTSESIKLKNGQTVTGNAVVWTAGVRPNIIAPTIHNLSVTDRGKIVVDEFLRVRNFDNVFALGDIMEFIDEKTQKPIPGLAYTAQAQGKLIAKNISASLKGKKLAIYQPEYDAWVAPVGAKYAVAHINSRITVSGFLAWVVRNLVDLRYFASVLPLNRALGLFKKDIMLFSKND